MTTLYVPAATSTTTGVVKPDGTTITVATDGTLTATATTPGIATTSTAGLVMASTDIEVDSEGAMSIGTGAVTNSKLADNAVTVAKLGDGLVTASTNTKVPTGAALVYYTV